MTTKRKPYQTYPKEFKLEALRLMESSGRPSSEIAMELGIRRNQLQFWGHNFGVNFGVRVKTNHCSKKFLL